MYFSDLYFPLQRDTLTHAAALKGTLGMNVAFWWVISNNSGPEPSLLGIHLKSVGCKAVLSILISHLTWAGGDPMMSNILH